MSNAKTDEGERRAAALPVVIAAGASAGVSATLAMSAVMLGFQKLGFLGRTPPRHIVEHALSRLRLRRHLSPRTRRALSALAHLAFGAAQGVVYALGHEARAATSGGKRKPTPKSGVPFALGVWAVSYAGWIPAFGVLPSPSRDRPGRPTSMVIAHAVYGAVLARTFDALLVNWGNSAPRPTRSFASEREEGA